MSKRGGHKTRFQPGVSGNPSGRPRALRWLIDEGRKETPKLWAELLKIAYGHTDARLRKEALIYALDRTHGKPATSVEVAGTIEHQHWAIRVPAIVGTAADWERLYGPGSEYQEARVIEHKPVQAPPPVSEPLPENPPIPGGDAFRPHPLTGAENPRLKQGHSCDPAPFPNPNDFSRPAGDLATFDRFNRSGKPLQYDADGQPLNTLKPLRKPRFEE